MIPSVLSSQLIRGTKDFLSTTFPSSTPAFFDMMDTFINEEGKLFKGPYISVALPFRTGDAGARYFPDTLSQNFKPFYHQDIIKKYNLLEFVDNCFIYMQSVLTHEKYLPFTFYREESTNDMKGLIYKQQTLDKEKDEYIEEKIAYFSADQDIDEKTYISVYEKFELSKLTIITPDEKQTDYSLRMSEFYESIQLYKDYWYQEALDYTTNYISINPGIIRLLQVAFNGSPYKPQYPLINLLDNIFTNVHYDRNTLLNIITLTEASKIVEEKRLYES